jgi:ADP-ribosylation factor GTPase-activating protein 2/3
VLGGPRKPAAGKLGLGVKKLETKVDGSLFEQAPAEAPKPAPVVPAPAAAAAPAARADAAASAAPMGRGAYDGAGGAPSSSAAPVGPPPPARGKDGHLTIGGLAGDDFFRDPLGRAAPPKPSGPAAFGGIGFVPAPAAPMGGGGAGGSGARPVEAEAVAQKRFANAKAISSRDFEANSGEVDYERQMRLSKFSGASAISSDAYFDRPGAGGGGGGSGSGGGRGGSSAANDLDLTAAELVNRLSYHVRRGGGGLGVGVGCAAACAPAPPFGSFSLWPALRALTDRPRCPPPPPPPPCAALPLPHPAQPPRPSRTWTR